jgi:hypothetical protein
MLPHNATAIVGRNEEWRGASATEPHECGWAREAVIFLRALKVDRLPAGTQARVQISPDGMRWLDEGTSFTLPTVPDGIGVARVTAFGGWLRLAADIPEGATISILVTLHLKA